MLMWIVRMLVLRRFGAARSLVVFGLFGFVRRLFGRRHPVPQEVRAYQPSQGSSQTVQRRPR